MAGLISLIREMQPITFNIAVGVAAAGVTMGQGRGEPAGSGAEKEHVGDGEAPVYFAGKGGVAAEGVGGAGEFDGGEQEAAGVAGVKFAGGGNNGCCVCAVISAAGGPKQ